MAQAPDPSEQLTRKASASAKSPSRARTGAKLAGVPSIISTDVVIRGTIESHGEIQFDGEIDGNLIAKGLVVGEAAKVQGEIIAEKVRVCGSVDGSIRGVQVELAATAQVHGDIVHTSLSIENGARFEGNCRHSDNPLSDSPSKPMPKPRPIPAPPPTSADAAASPVSRAPANPGTTPQRAAPMDAEIHEPGTSTPASRELMPARSEPAPDRNFVAKSPASDLR